MSIIGLYSEHMDYTTIMMIHVPVIESYAFYGIYTIIQLVFGLKHNSKSSMSQNGHLFKVCVIPEKKQYTTKYKYMPIIR